MKKKIMVIDDSALMRRVMCDIINSDSSFEVTDVSKDGQEAYEKLLVNQYDALVLDVYMPRMDGLELLKKLRAQNINVLVIMASTLTKEGSVETLTALELGAVDFVTKPGNVIEARGEEFSSELISLLNAVLIGKHTSSASRTLDVRKNEPLPTKSVVKNGNKLVALACSTGGPKALQEVIPYLDANMDAPVVLVQHMPKGFTKSMAERLNDTSKVSVTEACEGDILKKGHVYIAPGGYHLQVVKNSDGTHRVHLDDSPAIGGLKPCADVMYESLVNTSYDEICCVVLTGMGADGTKGILKLRQKKKVFTISQDEQSCVVYGMPRAIYESGAVNTVVSLKNVASTIITNVGVR